MFKATITKIFLVLISILSLSAGNVPLGMLALLGIPIAIIYFGVNSANSSDDYRAAKRNERGFFTDNRGHVKTSLPAYKPKYTLDSEKKGAANTAAGIGLVAAASALASDEHSDINESFSDDDTTINPATGLPIDGGVDSSGNPFGTDGSSGIGFPEDSAVNPATGLSMTGGIGGIDSAGNTYGNDNMSVGFSHDMLDATTDSIGSFDTTDTFDSSDSFSSIDDNW